MFLRFTNDDGTTVEINVDQTHALHVVGPGNQIVGAVSIQGVAGVALCDGEATPAEAEPVEEPTSDAEAVALDIPPDVEAVPKDAVAAAYAEADEEPAVDEDGEQDPDAADAPAHAAAVEDEDATEPGTPSAEPSA